MNKKNKVDRAASEYSLHDYLANTQNSNESHTGNLKEKSADFVKSIAEEDEVHIDSQYKDQVEINQSVINDENNKVQIQLFQEKIILLCEEKEGLLKKNTEQRLQIQQLESQYQEEQKNVVEDLEQKLQLQVHLNNHQRKLLQKQINELPVQIVRDLMYQLTTTFTSLRGILSQELPKQDKVELLGATVNKLDLLSYIQHEEVEGIESYQNVLKQEISNILKDVGQRFNLLEIKNETEVKHLSQKLDKRYEENMILQSELYQIKEQNVKLLLRLKSYQKKDQENMVMIQQNKTLLHMVTQLECYQKFTDKFEEETDPIEDIKAPDRLFKSEIIKKGKL